MDNGSISVDESKCNICNKRTNYENYFVYHKDCYHVTVYCEHCLKNKLNKKGSD